jgi:peptide/nickel transport system permease protein
MRVRELLLQRIALGILTLFCVSVVIFLAIQLLPGDIATQTLGQNATPDAVAAFRRELGLDQPAVLRYFHWVLGLLTGDLGVSLISRRQVYDLVASRFGNTLQLAIFATILAVPVALVLGILAAAYNGSFFDRAINAISLTVTASPEFFVAYILIVILAVQYGLLPAVSTLDPGLTFGEQLVRILMPALVLSIVTIGHIMRLTRASIISLMSSPYVEMARLKGVSEMRIILRHVLPNAWAPIINTIVINIAYLVTGVVVVEVVFAYPGLGQLLVDAVSQRDVPVVQACCLIFASTYIILYIIADILTILTNPRIMHRTR